MLKYECRSCRKRMSIKSVSPMVRNGIMAFVFLPLAVIGSREVMSSTFDGGTLILTTVFALGGLFCLWKLVGSIRNRLMYPIIPARLVTLGQSMSGTSYKR
jgi:hypothetical protein